MSFGDTLKSTPYSVSTNPPVQGSSIERSYSNISSISLRVEDLGYCNRLGSILQVLESLLIASIIANILEVIFVFRGLILF